MSWNRLLVVMAVGVGLGGAAPFTAPARGAVSDIDLEKTVGTDPSTCAPTTAITVTVGTPAIYCYQVTNTGTITFTNHHVTDSELGVILSNGYPYTLPPAASVFVTQTFTPTMPGMITNTAIWTAWCETPGCDGGAGFPTRVDDAMLVVLSDAENGTGIGPAGCSDGLDGDGDGLIDCGDPDCQGAPPCIAPAPVLGPNGFVIAALLLLAVGGVALTLQRRNA